MAEEKPGSNGTPAHRNGSSNGNGRSRRTSQLMAAASALPTVESSLEDFIARANSTAVDVGGWGLGEEQLRLERAEAERLAREAEDARLREVEARARAESE